MSDAVAVVKKRKVKTTEKRQNANFGTAELARALEEALEAMDPPFDDNVHGGILRLIAEYTEPPARFDPSGAAACFTISNDGMTAMRNVRHRLRAWGRFICVLPSFSEGALEVTFRIDEDLLLSVRVGVVPAAMGVVPAAKTYESQGTDGAWKIGYMYCSSGVLYAEGHQVPAGTLGGYFDWGEGYQNGDEITVCLDLDANTVAFRKNGTKVGPPHNIAHADSYHFAFEARSNSDAVTIVDTE